MKKDLLALSLVIATSLCYAQDTYIGNKVIVKVQPNTLFYNGGDVNIYNNTQNTGTTLAEVVKNEGFVEIAKDYKNSVTSTTGTEFINLYTDAQSYGQVIIKGSNSSTTGKMTMQKKSVNSADIQQYPMTFPFQGNVEDLMYSFDGKNPSNFRGNCGLNARCSQRYWMTLFHWNNNSIVNDAVPTGASTKPGEFYLLNIIPNTGLNTEFNGTNLINYKGIPAPDEITFSNLRTLPPSISDIESLPYNSWKNRINAYNEYYWSYMGNYNSATDLAYGKNIFRFGNPYTSNLDLSIPATWMTQSSLPFEITKLSTSYKHTWNNTTGSSHNSIASTQYVSANYVNGAFAGNREAILIRPLEMFQVSFSQNNLVTLGVNFKQVHKTFNQTPTPPPSPRTQNNRFHQLKVTLIDNDENIASEPVYLAAADVFETGVVVNKNSESAITLLEEDVDGNVIANANTLINTFKDDYIAKPVHLSLKDFPVGNKYQMKFNLQESNIFTDDVVKFTNGDKFYLYDKLKDSYTEITGNTTVDINITDKSADQYTFYWKQTPKTLSTVDLDKKFKTQIYKFTQDAYHIKLDSSKKIADLEIYSIAGSKVADQKNINISNSNDVKLNIPRGNSGVYIVKVIYNDGTENNLKVLVD